AKLSSLKRDAVRKFGPNRELLRSTKYRDGSVAPVQFFARDNDYGMACRLPEVGHVDFAGIHYQ
ncbi:MAG TPA: hypothetical protein VH682_25440, partial [Gemmataceae bacterium]